MINGKHVCARRLLLLRFPILKFDKPVIMKLILFFCLISASASLAQSGSTSLPYRELPKPPEHYNSGTVASRLLDGLGFRFYWATDGLRDSDLAFKPGEDARTSLETIKHIFGMSYIILNVAEKKSTHFPQPDESLSFAQIREITLRNIQKASDIIAKANLDDLSEHPMIFESTSGSAEYPFWNLVNGPISDCLWHVGQVVTFRRSSGNPFSNKVSVLSGR